MRLISPLWLLPLAGALPSCASERHATSPLLAGEWEVVHDFRRDAVPGNVAVAPSGRIFLSLHEFWGPFDARVVELTADGDLRPYPTVEWAGPLGDSGKGLNGVLGLRVDRQGVLWLLDGQTPESNGRLVAWNTEEERLERVIPLKAPATTPDSFLNDLAVDLDHQTVYIADSSGAVIVVDLRTNATRRVLEGHRSTVPEDVDMVIDGKVVTLGGAPARIGINPITIDAQNAWLYYGPMSGTSIYRVPTAALRDATLTPEQVATAVQVYGPKPPSDGSTIDSAGNVYITSVTEDAVGVLDATGTYRVLLQDDGFSWPDGFAIGPDGSAYVTINELHRSPPLNDGVDAYRGEFKLVRFAPLAPAAQGR
ncbi:MAG: L-dopachrome tautomerase-related protein [Planctomycetota bacterium]|jgi:sugar lactone lactonase YvrE